MSDESTYPKKGSSGSGSYDAWSVEARYNALRPKVFGDVLLDNRWTKFAFHKSEHGIPAGPRFKFARDELELLGYSAAQALRWGLHAHADVNYEGALLETRLIKHVVKYSYSSEAISEHAYVGGEDHSNLMPDWGKKEPITDAGGEG